MAHKRNLKKGTRIYLKNQNSTTGKLRFRKSDLKKFMLSWLFLICLWKFNHKRFNVLANFWRWNHTKNMHQIIVINFSKSLSNYRIFWRKNALFSYFIYHFFSIVFSSYSFFLDFLTHQTVLIQISEFFFNVLKFHNKKQPMQNLKNRKILILEFKNRIRNFKNTME